MQKYAYPFYVILNREESMQYQIQENCLIIYLPKDVDHCSVQVIQHEADTIIKQNHIKHVIFDFKETQFMDSSGIGAVMGRYKLINMLGGEVWGVHINPRIKKILEMSGMHRIMQLYGEEVDNEYNQRNEVNI